MKPILHDIISFEQTGFLKGRFIGENVRTVLDIISYCNKKCIPGYLLFLDFEKAFDTLEHSFIYDIFDYFMIDSSFKKWIKTMYCNAEACVINNGHCTEFFAISRGVRQGCPLSPYIFILCTEVLCRRIKQDNTIRGIHFNNVEFKLSQYADDTTLFIDNDDNSINSVVRIINDFSNISGLHINYDKCVLFPVGGHRPGRTHNNLFQVSFGPIEYLGITFTNHEEDFFKLNYVPKLSRLKNVLRMWSIRDLTPLGKITIVKSLALSQIVYLFIVLPNPPPDFIKELNQVILDFVWSNKRHKVKFSSLINDIKGGGLCMTHIESFIKSLKCSRVRRLCSQNDTNWKCFFHSALREHGGDFLFKCNMNAIDCQGIDNTFIRQVCESWFHYSYVFPNNDYGNQIIFSISHMKINDQTFFHRGLYEAQAYYVHCFFHDNGKPKEFQTFCDEFALTSLHFTTYFGIISAIPQSWRVYLCGIDIFVNKLNSNETKFLLYKSNATSNKVVYSTIVKEYNNIPTCVSKWESELGSSFNWSQIFSMPFICTKESRLRYFQFKCIHRILTLNDFLCKIKYIDSSMCTFCHVDPETITHIFWNCPKIKCFWNAALSLIISDNITLCQEIVLFGDVNNIKSPLNFFILHGKYFIYMSRAKGESPNGKHFVRFFTFQLEVEKHRRPSETNDNFFKYFRV